MEKILLILGYIPLIAAIVILYSKLVRIRNQQKTAAAVEEPSLPVSEPRILKEDNRSSKEYELEDIKDRLCDLMERERIYLNPNIRVTEVAARLYTNKSYLSQAIRIKMNKNFCQLLHYYRVQEAMRLYAENPDLSIAQLCRKVGFNSMTTFTQAFGRNTGFTPADWCKQFRRQNCYEKKIEAAGKIR